MMRKVAVARCALVVLTLSMLAASGADKTVTNKEFGFEITFPESWVVTTVERGFAAGIRGDANKHGLLLQVRGCGVSAGGDSKKLADTVDAKKRTLINEKLIEKADVKLDGKEAYRVIREYDYDDKGVRFKGVFYFLVAGERGYMLAIASSADVFEKYDAKDIDAIVKSFKLIEAK
ncbi:MAG TPA: PsbP-related protein [Planctomycetota bacterium]|nr:PsbP-related protein [Planctomycetota bacterium]